MNLLRLSDTLRHHRWVSVISLVMMSLWLTACSTQSIELYPKGYQPLDMSLYQTATSDDTATDQVHETATQAPILKAIKQEPTFQIFLTQEAPDRVFNQAIELSEERTIYTDNQVLLTRDDLDNVEAKEDAQGRAWVILTLSPEGAQKLFAITQANMGKNLTIRIKGQIVAVLEITEELERELIIPMRTAYQASVLQQQITDGD